MDEHSPAPMNPDPERSPEETARETKDIRDFLEHAVDGMHWVAGDGTILWANPAELELLGYARDEYVGHHIAEFHVDAATIDDILARLWRNETLRNCESRMRCKDGSIRDVLISSSVLWRDGEFVHTRCVTKDVTDQKRVECERERALRQLAAEHAVTKILSTPRSFGHIGPELLRTIGEVGEWHVGALWLVDESKERLRCAEFWQRLGDRARDFEASTRASVFACGVGLPGRIWASGKPGWIADVVDDDNFPRVPIARRAGLHSAIGFPIRVRDRVTGVLEFFGQDVRQADGDVLQLFDAVGAQIGHFIERRETDEVRDRLAAIVDSSDDAILSKTLDGIISSWNRGAENMFGYSAAEAVGQPITLIIPDDRRQEEDMVLARLRRGERINHYQTERQTKDGGRLSVSISVSPIRNADGQIIGVSKVARDVTERERAAAALAELHARTEQAVRDLDAARSAAESANRTKDEFLAMLGHELRNPLAPILTALQLMQLRGDESALRERAVIDRQVRHLVRLVDDLLDVSRIARGKIDLRSETIELAEIVARAIEMASPLLEERQHHLTVAVARTGLLIRGDATRLAQVVMNLLTNAAKYTASRGHITVKAAHDRDDIVLSVKDTGIGIAPGLLPRVFDLFVQGSQTSERSRGGLGLGLTIVRSLVELHGGSVEAFSAGEGSGSEFVMRLPAIASALQPIVAPRRVEPLPAAGRLRVLVVDDNADAAQMIADALGALGHTTRIALDGPSALATAAAFHPDVALLDLGLPVMDGYELAQHLRTGPGGRPPVLVAVTGYGQETDRLRSRAAGFCMHIVKPVDLQVLNRALDRVAAGEFPVGPPPEA